MALTVGDLLHPRRREVLLDTLVAEGAGSLAGLVAVTCAGAAVYGAVLGSWRGGAMVPAVALKLPLVLLATAGLTLPLNWMTALLGGLRLPFGAAAALSFLALAEAALVLASLAPAAFLFTIAAPAPGLDARTTHNVLYLLHTALVGGAGLTGAGVLGGALGRVTGDVRRARRVARAWIVAFALVGGEVAWALRPFVGSIYLPVALVRPDALDGNVYELVWTDILPHLLDLEGEPLGRDDDRP